MGSPRRSEAQAKLIFKAMLRGQRVNKYGALALAGSDRLAARIDDIKNARAGVPEGVKVSDCFIRVECADGGYARVKEYWLEPEEIQRLLITQGSLF